MKQVVPLFLPADYTTHLRRLKQEHSAELSALLKPLEQLSLSEREAVGAAGTAQAAALAWEANEDVFAALLPRALQRTLALPAPGIDDWALPEPANGGAGTYDSATQLLAHLARDWSADGATARAKTHRPVLRALRRVELQWRRRGAAALRVLVPGAGMGRLAWEVCFMGHPIDSIGYSVVAFHSVFHSGIPQRIATAHPHSASHRLILHPSHSATHSAPHSAPPTVHPPLHAQVARRGHRVEANDASSSMMVAAHALLSGAVARDALRFFPRVRCEAGALRRAPCLAASRAPDVAPSIAHGGGNLTLQVGAFEQLYRAERHGTGAAQPWDALVTSYFIDTLADPAGAVRIAWDLLAPGGVWINVGPLHWHQPKLGFLRLRCALAMRTGHARCTHGTRMAHMHSAHAWRTHGARTAHAWHAHGTHARRSASCGAAGRSCAGCCGCAASLCASTA